MCQSVMYVAITQSGRSYRVGVRVGEAYPKSIMGVGPSQMDPEKSPIDLCITGKGKISLQTVSALRIFTEHLEISLTPREQIHFPATFLQGLKKFVLERHNRSDRFIMPANTTLSQDKATLLMLWAAMGGAKQTLTNGSDDVSKWKGIGVDGGRVISIGERMFKD